MTTSAPQAGRAAIYLAAVYNGLVALAFTGQLFRLGAALYIFGLVLLPTLAFVGLTTFDRALHNAVEDAQLAGRINRVRQFYFDAAPQVARYLPPPGAVSPWEVARQAGVSSPFWSQFLTIAAALAWSNRPDRRHAWSGRTGRHRDAGSVGVGRNDHRRRRAGRALRAAVRVYTDATGR